MRGEEEGVEVEAEVLEGVVGGGEDGDALGGVLEGGGQAGFEEGEGEGAEVGWEDCEEGESWRRWKEDGV